MRKLVVRGVLILNSTLIHALEMLRAVICLLILRKKNNLRWRLRR